MAVYAKEVSGRLDRMERRLSNVEARSAPGTPQSAISIADSPVSQQNKPDSSDVDSNPDEEEVAREVGAFASLYIYGYMYMYMYTLQILSPALITARRQRAAEKQAKRERKKRRLDDLVAQRLAKKPKSESEEPLPNPPNGDSKESTVNSAKTEPLQTQVGVFISLTLAVSVSDGR